MTFQLQTEKAPAGLALLGQYVEIRELSYGAMRETMAASEQPGQSAERLLAASLYVDGQPIGYEALRGLPGRFSGAIADALGQTLRLHGLDRTATPSEAPPGGAGTAAAANASDAPKG
jgi:hypothetical protein